MLDDFTTRDHAPAVMQEIGEQPVFVRGQLYRSAIDDDAPGLGVEPHRPAHDLTGGVPDGAAQQGADAGQNLLHVEGLGNVIIGAGVETLHLVAPSVARGQDQHRHDAPGAAPFLEHGDAILFRQADVEHHGVVGLGVAEKLPLLAVIGAIDRIARLLQSRDDLAVQILVVLHHKQPQWILLLGVRRVSVPDGKGSACRSRRRRKPL